MTVPSISGEIGLASAPSGLTLAPLDRRTLERWSRGRTTPQRLVSRSRIILLLATGVSAREAARQLGLARHTVALWKSRFLLGGCDALTHDKPGRGRRPSAS